MTKKEPLRAHVLCMSLSDREPWHTWTGNALDIQSILRRVDYIQRDGARALIRIPSLDTNYTLEEYLALPWLQEALAEEGIPFPVL